VLAGAMESDETIQITDEVIRLMDRHVVLKGPLFRDDHEPGP